jgi:peptidyl-dipeptidase Dcp
MNNPLLSDFNTPFNAIPFDKIKPEHFEPAFEVLFKETREKLSAIWNNTEEPTFDNTVIALERVGSKLGRIASIIFNLNVAETNPKIQTVTRNISPLFADFRNDIVLNEALFVRIKTVYNNTDKSKLSIEDNKLLDKVYKDFLRNGANLDNATKEKYRAITKELSQLTVDFGENVLAETNNYFLHITKKEDLSGLPEDFIGQAKTEAEQRKLDGWVITLQFPSFGPFMKYADNRELRKEVFFAYGSRCLKENEFNNAEIIKRITTLRLELAKILGFDTYADFVLSNRMAESTEKVNSFLNDLLIATMPVAKEEFKEMQAFAAESNPDIELNGWDWSYYSEKLKKQKFDVDDEITRPYFELAKIEKGVFNLATALYGLTFKENKEIPVYHPDVTVFEVYDEKNKFISLLYMDYFPRESKKGGAWMTEYLQQHINEKGENIRPHVSLVLNFTKPTQTKPSLLTYTEVTTLLHEFGHALHGMLSNCKYEELAGTNVYRDFVELPSQLLENWADQKEWLDQVAVHYKTGEKIPNELIQKLINAKNFLTGYFSSRQLSFSISDLKWHSITEPITGDITEFEKEAMAPTRLLPSNEGIAMAPAFSHIFAGGYAAGYYSYKWAEVLDADAFALFKEKGIFNKEIATSFRDNVLSKGGTEHPMDLYIKFRGQAPTVDALLERSGLKK